jgi:hypothetical protein
MGKPINFDALKLEANQCPRQHICIKHPELIFGAVDYCVNYKVLFVKPENTDYCPYKNYFGSAFFCSCPLHMQIYLDDRRKEA